MGRLTALVIGAAVFVASGSTSAAASADIDALTSEAVHVLEGRIEAVTELRIGRDAALHKDYRVRVHRVLHGNVAAGTRVIVREQVEAPVSPRTKRSRRSARRGGSKTTAAPAAHLQTGQRVILFVAPGDGARTVRLVRRSAGAWLIDSTSSQEVMAYPLVSTGGVPIADLDAGLSLATLAARIEAAAGR